MAVSTVMCGSLYLCLGQHRWIEIGEGFKAVVHRAFDDPLIMTYALRTFFITEHQVAVVPV